MVVNLLCFLTRWQACQFSQVVCPLHLGGHLNFSNMEGGSPHSRIFDPHPQCLTLRPILLHPPRVPLRCLVKGQLDPLPLGASSPPAWGKIISRISTHRHHQLQMLKPVMDKFPLLVKLVLAHLRLEDRPVVRLRLHQDRIPSGMALLNFQDNYHQHHSMPHLATVNHHLQDKF